MGFFVLVLVAVLTGAPEAVDDAVAAGANGAPTPPSPAGPAAVETAAPAGGPARDDGTTAPAASPVPTPSAPPTPPPLTESEMAGPIQCGERRDMPVEDYPTGHIVTLRFYNGYASTASLRVMGFGVEGGPAECCPAEIKMTARRGDYATVTCDIEPFLREEAGRKTLADLRFDSPEDLDYGYDEPFVVEWRGPELRFTITVEDTGWFVVQQEF